MTAVNEGGYRPDAAMSQAMMSALSGEVALLQALGRPAETANARNALTAPGITGEPGPLAGLPGLSVTYGEVAGAVPTVRLLTGALGGRSVHSTMGRMTWKQRNGGDGIPVGTAFARLGQG